MTGVATLLANAPTSNADASTGAVSLWTYTMRFPWNSRRQVPARSQQRQLPRRWRHYVAGALDAACADNTPPGSRRKPRIHGKRVRGTTHGRRTVGPGLELLRLVGVEAGETASGSGRQLARPPERLVGYGRRLRGTATQLASTLTHGCRRLPVVKAAYARVPEVVYETWTFIRSTLSLPVVTTPLM
jgi:hypothetical protein